MVKKFSLRGDTLIEVMFAVAVFGLGAVGAIALMNTGLASVQNSLETTMARQEIDAQAEALRFIHDAYLTEPNTKSTDGTTGEEISTNNFRNLWQDIVAQAYPPSTVSTSGSYSGGVVSEDPDFFTRTVDNKSNCDTLFTTSTSNSSFGIPSQSFIINPRGLNLLTEKDSATGNTKVLSHTDIRQNILISAKDTYSSFTTAATYPRLLYGTSNTAGESLTDAFIENNAIKYKSAVTRLDSSEGIWVTAITSNSGLQCYDENGNPEGGIRPDFYDFHIQTCWDSISGNASVISSTVRLFNPDQVNLRKQGMITFDNVEWEKYDNNTNHQGPCSGSDPPEHVITNGTDIEFVGYTRDNMDEGVKYSIADRLYFTLDVDVDTSGILTHPGGKGLTITIGPIEANLTDSGGTITGSESKTVDARTFHLQMVRAGNHYTACADSICVEADSDATDVSIDYNFKHNGHCCSAISRAKLSNIDMTSNEIDDQTTGGCVRVTPTVTEQEPIIGGDEETTPPGNGPEPDPTEEVEETIIATDANPLQNIIIKFDLTDYENLNIKSASAISAHLPNVNKVANGMIIENGMCNITTSHNATFCGFPYATKRDSFGQYDGYAEGTFVIYFDSDSFAKGYYSASTPISDFWNYKDLNVNVYFYDHIYYFSDLANHEAELARYKISSKTAKVINNNGRYWILARIYGSPGSRNYWADKIEIINQRTNRNPSEFLK